MGAEQTTGAPPTEPVLLLDRRGDILIATLNRPRKGNALSTELILELGELTRQLRDEYSDVKVVVLTGRGEKVFSAGADITNLVGLTELTATQQMRTGQLIFDALEDAPQAVIAAVNGIAFGGGLELAMACDLRIAAPGARFGQPEMTLGNIPGWGGTQRLPRLIGQGRALEMILTGESIGAERALEIGLVNSVAEDVLATALELAGRIAAMSATAIAAAKRAVYAGARSGISQGLVTEAALVGRCSVSPEQQAAVQAFFDRKKSSTPASTNTKEPR